MLHLLSRASAFLVVCLLQINVSYAATYGLNTTCSPPVSQGGTGYCGPSYCSAINNPATGCVFTAKTYNYATIISGLRSKTCTQSTDPRCTSAALKALIVGQGIKAAYCNDQFLVLQTDGTTGYANTLTSIKNPPAAVGSDGKTCVTRYVNQGFATVKIPLFPTLLTTADPRINNINTNSFPNGGADGDAAYMSTSTMNTAATYGLPTRGSVGISIAGQDIFPAFNNLATLAPQKCEVDACNEHVGGGGGQPHLHGDPFGSWCLYSAANYSSTSVHPPQIGWALDGPSIYGRHLSTNNLGYSTALDSCGGHVHGNYAYHYHTQVLTATTDAGAYPGTTKGQTYYASTTGPYQCFKGDISKITNYWGMLATSFTSSSPDTTTYMCSGTTNYYAASGITVPNTVAPTPSTPPVSAPSVKPVTSKPTSAKPTAIPTNTAIPTTLAPTKFPTFSPTRRPTFSPTPTPTKTPTNPPTRKPTRLPTSSPTRFPTPHPTVTPTKIPTLTPTKVPTMTPTLTPTKIPTVTPTRMPTNSPTNSPTKNPTATPTVLPTNKPTITPTKVPTSSPTTKPTMAPTVV